MMNGRWGGGGGGGVGWGGVEGSWDRVWMMHSRGIEGNSHRKGGRSIVGNVWGGGQLWWGCLWVICL